MYSRAFQPITKARQVSRTAMFAAPSRGWIRNESLAKSGKGEGAEVLENWFPTPEGCRMRRGSVKRATIDDAVTHLAVYDAGIASKLFATDGTSIYDVTSPADPDVAVVASVSGLGSGAWSSVQIATAGGEFLVMVNGQDDMRQYNGATWTAINAGSSPAITGVLTSSLSHVWKFASRLFFVEKDTMSAWYLGTNAISGAATELPLGGVFQSGGSLLFGFSWSYDAGDGLDDYCCFATTEGEVAVYQGTDPSSSNTWSKVGVYRIGRPLGKNGWFKAGGDVAILTDDGIIPVSAAIKSDRAALKGKAITYPIEEAWRQVVRERGGAAFPFTVALWHSETMLVVGLPTFSGFSAACLVANARTGAWALYRGWDTRCVVVFDDKLYFGTADGTIVEGETQGADQGEPYSAVCVPRFETFRSPAEKVAVAARVIARSNNVFTPQLFANADYEVDVPVPADADSAEDENTWDNGIWGTTVWGAEADRKQRLSEWQAAAAVGQALAPGLVVTSGRTTAPDIELIALHLQYEEGQVFG